MFQDQKEWKEQIEGLLGELTLEEKCGMIHGAGLFETAGVERLGIPPLKTSDGPMGVRAEFKNDEWVSIGHTDDYVTYLPSNTAIAATWDPDLAGESGRILGQEARGRGKDMILAPGINIQKVPYCGRNFEYMSEDPYLVSELVAPLVSGIQENDVSACVKHFALNQQETERLWVNAEVDDKTLYEVYLPGFEAAVTQGGSYSVMTSYNLYSGAHCSRNQRLLGDILRDEWGYDGVIISDWGAVHDTEQTANSPLDVEMSVTYNFDEYYFANPLIRAVKEGRVKEETVDEKVRHVLLLMLRIGKIRIEEKNNQTGKEYIAVKNPDRNSGSYADTCSPDGESASTPERIHAVAAESVVLLKNEEQVLPLDPKADEKILVIGDNAESTQANGGGSAEIKALYEITPLLGIKRLLGGNADISYVRGYAPVQKPQRSEDRNWQENSLDREAGKRTRGDNSAFIDEIRERARQMREEALEAAKKADRVIFVGGLNHNYDVEGMDRPSMELPYEQDQLIQELLQIHPDMVIVMMAGSAVDMSAWSDKAKAILWMSYAGAEGGAALADNIFGIHNPGGHLPFTMPAEGERGALMEPDSYPGRELTEEEKSRMTAHLTETYTEGRLVGYRYYEKKGLPVQFPFGFGLSYTSFAISNGSASLVEHKKDVETFAKEDPACIDHGAGDGTSEEGCGSSCSSGSDCAGAAGGCGTSSGCGGCGGVAPAALPEEVLAMGRVMVTNTGDRYGSTVVQIYIGRDHPEEDEPVKALRGFVKVDLDGGKRHPFTFFFTEADFSHYDPETKNFVIHPDTYHVYVGENVRDAVEIGSFELG